MSKLYIAFYACWLGLLGASAQHVNLPHEPGEILLTYEVTEPGKKPLKGKAILREHDQVIENLQAHLSTPILDQKPVFRSYVNQLVQENLSEGEMQSRVRQRHASRRGILSSKSGPTSPYNFSRSLKLSVADEDFRVVFGELVNLKGKIISGGYSITDVSLNLQLEANSEPNDPLFSIQYAHALTGAVNAWEVERGNEEVVIGVIDSGIDLNHEDLAGNLVPGRDFVDRPDLRSWQLIEGEDYYDPDNNPTDFDGHGTYVAGIIAAQDNNGKGISGVCPSCKVLPLRAGARHRKLESADEDTNRNGRRDTITTATSSVANVADALLYGIAKGVDIINYSYGSPGRMGRDFERVLTEAVDNGVLVISSAGNDNTSEMNYPAAYEQVIAVASTNERDQKSSFSNYGSWVDVSAPGSNVLTTVPINGQFPPENLTQLKIDDQRVDALPFSFTGLTNNGPLQGSVSFVGLARAQDVDNPAYDWDLEGKIALIERGEIPFKEKVDRVNSFGAIGAIIYNNETGSFGGTLQEEQTNPIPVVSISRAEGEGIRNSLDNSGDIRANLQLEAIFGYSRLNGTSFSAPYVAGMAGLILAQNPTLSPEGVKAKILESVDNIDALNPRFIGQLGTGRVSLAKLFPAVVTDTQDPLREGTLQVYPNPLDRILVIDVPTGIQLNSLRVINPLGQEMQALPQEDLQGRTRLSLDFSNLPSGYYILQGESDSGRWHARVLKGE